MDGWIHRKISNKINLRNNNNNNKNKTNIYKPIKNQ